MEEIRLLGDRIQLCLHNLGSNFSFTNAHPVYFIKNMNVFKQNTNRLTDTENKWMVARGEGGEEG